MKTFLYKLFALIFNLSRAVHIKPGRIALLAPHPREKYDSFSAIKDYLSANNQYEITEINVPHNKSNIFDYFKFFILDSAKLAKSEYIFLNDNFMPLADLKISGKTTVIQLWHGEGAFKKFGLLLEQSNDIKSRIIKCSEKTDFIICTSEKIRSVYADAFGTNTEKVIALGSARNDYLINLNKSETRKKYEIKYPQIKDKELILYAPTFRDNDIRDSTILENTDFRFLAEKLGDEYSILIKLHPGIHSASIPDSIINVTDESITELTIISDLLITDYSSVCMNFVYLKKPVVFYAYDLENYKSDRSFCFGYEDYVPGPIIKDFRELPEIIKNPPDFERIDKFGEFNFKYIDNQNTKRIIEKVMGNR